MARRDVFKMLRQMTGETVDKCGVVNADIGAARNNGAVRRALRTIMVEKQNGRWRYRYL